MSNEGAGLADGKYFHSLRPCVCGEQERDRRQQFVVLGISKVFSFNN